MTDFDEKKRNAASTFANVVRTSSIASEVDAQRLMMAMTHLMMPLEPGQALDLTPMEEFLQAQNIRPDGIEEVFVFFASRQDKHGFEVRLPASMQSIPDAKRERIIEGFRKAALGQTFSGARPAELPPPGQKIDAPGRDAYTKKKKKREGNNPVFLLVGALIILGGGAFAISSWQDVPQGAADLPALTDPTALPCDPLAMLKTQVMCDVPTATIKKYPAAELKARAERTLAVIKASQPTVTRLVVRQKEDGLPVRW